MKSVNQYSAALLAVTMLWGLPGCSHGPPSNAPPARQNAAGEPTAGRAASPTTAQKSTIAEATLRPGLKIIKNAEVSLRVTQVLTTSDQIRGFAAQVGGFVSNSQISADSPDGATGMVEVRVPSERLEPFLAHLPSWGKLESRSEQGEDVTAAYYDDQSRARNLGAEESRLQQMMKSAGKVADLLQVERELARVQGESDLIQGRLRHVDDLVAFSTVKINLISTNSLRPIAPDNFWDLSDTVSSAWYLFRWVVRFLAESAVYLLALLPFGLPFWLARRSSQRKRRVSERVE